MKIMSVSDNTRFGAWLRVTNAAKTAAQHCPTQNTVVSNLVFDRTMRKFNNMLSGEFPFAGNVFFDTISKKTKVAKPGTASNYELRINDQSVDFNFNHHSVFNQHGNGIEDKIENESNTQAAYLFDAYKYLRSRITAGQA